MTFTYLCAAGAEFDAEQRITDPKLAECPLCGKCSPKRLISGAPPFQLKAGPSGSWSDGGYALTPAQRKAEAKLGRKVTRRA